MSDKGRDAPRWGYYGVAFVVLAPIAYVLFVLLLAVVLVHGFGCTKQPAFFAVLVAPINWLERHSSWCNAVLEWLAKVCGVS